MFYREIITVYFKNYKEHVMYYVDKTENVLMLNLVIRSVVADFWRVNIFPDIDSLATIRKPCITARIPLGNYDFFHIFLYLSIQTFISFKQAQRVKNYFTKRPTALSRFGADQIGEETNKIVKIFTVQEM